MLILREITKGTLRDYTLFLLNWLLSIDLKALVKLYLIVLQDWEQ